MTKVGLDTAGLSISGIWVRRLRDAPSLTEEALSLAQVLQVWNLTKTMLIDQYRSAYAEVSRPSVPPAWVYLVELVGRPMERRSLLSSHPLAQVEPDEPCRILALVEPPEFLIYGALVETEHRRRMLWLQADLVQV